jgi:hypothetical protein
MAVEVPEPWENCYFVNPKGTCMSLLSTFQPDQCARMESKWLAPDDLQ